MEPPQPVEHPRSGSSTNDVSVLRLQPSAARKRIRDIEMASARAGEVTLPNVPTHVASTCPGHANQTDNKTVMLAFGGATSVLFAHR